MHFVFNTNYIFSQPTLRRVQGVIAGYPSDVAASDDDLTKSTQLSHPLSIEDVILSRIGIGTYFEAFDASHVWNDHRITFLVNPCKASTEQLIETFQQAGITLADISETPVKGTLGFYRF